MTDFENIISFESLYKAHRKARLSKRHKKEVVEFENNLSSNLWALHYDLKYGKYNVGGYHSFMIYDPKEREIQAISYRDRIVQHSLCDNYLMPLLDKKLIYDNVACRKNKGSSLAFSRLRKFMVEYYKKYGNSGYAIKLDIKKYFNSIDHTILKGKLRVLIEDDNILRLLFQIIDSYSFSPNRGLPMGNQTSQCFALLYLDSIDKYVQRKLKIRYYVRYMDDFVLLVGNKDDARYCIGAISEKIEELNIRLNAKSQIIPIKNGIRFLGWHFFIDKNGKIVQTVNQDTKRRIIKKVKSNKYLISIHKEKSNKLSLSLVSYKGFLSIGDGYNLFKRIKTIVEE